jgi:hypothetical protein
MAQKSIYPDSATLDGLSHSSLEPSQATQAEAGTGFRLPEEVLKHVPTGSSVVEPDSYMDESGRTYHGYKQGKYFLPNDPVRQKFWGNLGTADR